MKKSLFFVAAAALVLAGCNNDVTLDENTALVGSNTQKEIGFFPLSHSPKRVGSVTQSGAIEGTEFPTDLDMMVAAWDQTNNRDFFVATNFKYKYAGSAYDAGHEGYWGGETARYWPLSPTYVNFLAIANANGDNEYGVTWGDAGEKFASQVAVAMDDNWVKSKQRDLMYAIGNGQVTQSGNALTFPQKVDMQFKHAQAYLLFYLRAADAASTAIRIKNVEIYGGRFAGTATITQTNYNAQASQATHLFWTNNDATESYKSVLNDQTEKADVAESALTTSYVQMGKIIVVPNMSAVDAFADNGDTRIKISYYLNGNPYEYVYSIDNDTYVAGKKYIYNITFKLHEIFINPEVEDWKDGGSTFVDIPTYAIGENIDYGTIAKTAGQHRFRLTGVTGTPTLNVVTGTFVADPTYADGIVTFEVGDNLSGADKSYVFTIADEASKSSAITFKQAH